MNGQFNKTFGIWTVIYLVFPLLTFYNGWDISCVGSIQASNSFGCTPSTYHWFWFSGIGLGGVVSTALSSRLIPGAFDNLGINMGIGYSAFSIAVLAGTFSLPVLFWFCIVSAPLIALISSHYTPPEIW